MIDIIMPVYNAEKFIEKTLEYLEKQTFKKFRVILVNDGSNDLTKSLIENYILTSKMNIKLINQKNMGEGEARNTGLKFSDKKYILFLDCDDYLAENALEKYFFSIEKNKSQLIVSGYFYVNTKGTLLKSYILNNQVIKNKHIIIEKVLKKEIPLGIGNTLIKSEIIKNKLYFSKYKYAADSNFFNKMILDIDEITIISDPLFYYVKNENSVMHTKFSLQRLEGLEAINDTYEYYVKMGYGEYSEFFKYLYNFELMSVYISFLKGKNKNYVEEVNKILKTEKKIKLKSFFKNGSRNKYMFLLFYFSKNIFKKIYILYLFLRRLSNR